MRNVITVLVPIVIAMFFMAYMQCEGTKRAHGQKHEMLSNYRVLFKAVSSEAKRVKSKIGKWPSPEEPRRSSPLLESIEIMAKARVISGPIRSEDKIRYRI